MDLSIAEGKLLCTSGALTSSGLSRALWKCHSFTLPAFEPTRRLRAAGVTESACPEPMSPESSQRELSIKTANESVSVAHQMSGRIST